jgi:hypothetical protein
MNPQPATNKSTMTAPMKEDTTATASTTDEALSIQTKKIDQITSLQNGIDGLSLAMFEALRSLRDAVAPESGNLAGNGNNDESGPDSEELWHLYRKGDAGVVAMIEKESGGVISKREDFIRLHAKMEMEKDSELAMNLASTCLEKSTQINERVDSLPGMQRTRTEQMKRIEELVGLNQKAAQDLEKAHAVAREKRDSCRNYIRDNTCKALGIEESVGQE